jgi:hypothetical protein
MGARDVGLFTTLDRMIRAFSVQQLEMTRTAGALLASNTIKASPLFFYAWPFHVRSRRFAERQ